MDCVRCNGSDPQCGLCGGRGQTELVGCPRKAVPEDVWEALWYAGMTRDSGQWPEPGGLLDQTASCQQAFRFAWAEQKAWKARLNPRRDREDDDG